MSASYDFEEHAQIVLIMAYRKIPNISPGLIRVRKPFWGGLYSGGVIFRGAYIRRAFCVSVQVHRPQNLLLYIAIIGNKSVSLGQNHLYFASKPIYNRLNIF